jgi:N6-adenosine-specific RNA methylase IME4
MTNAERQKRYRRRFARTHPAPKTLAKQQRRAEREAELAEATRQASQALGSHLYGVLYVDPPWDPSVYSRLTGMNKHPANHYMTMSLADLAALKLPAHADCVLYLWAPVSQLANALDLVRGWGFEFRSAHGWKKPGIGTGFWVRDNLELLLIAVRGTVPAPAEGTQLAALIEAPKGEHSEKPEIFAEMIEQHWPNTPKLEMFARRGRPGWDSWGNEVISGLCLGSAAAGRAARAGQSSVSPGGAPSRA